MPKPLVALLGLAIVAAGCGGSGGDAGGGGGPGDTGGAAGATRVEVTMTDYFSIRPTPMAVAAGVPVTFVVTNLGELTHEFYVGDAAAQAAREQEMAASGGSGEDSPEGIVVPPGETKELTITLEPGSLIAGCHIPQHYARNMRASINVLE